MRLHTVVMLTAGLLIATAAAQDDQTQKEVEKFQGTWTVVSAEVDGKPDEGRKNTPVTFMSTNFTRKAGAKNVKGTYKLDPAAKPKSIDATFTNGADKGKTAPGIYTLEADSLKICEAPPGKDRPKEFVSKADSGHLLLVLKREKTEAPKPPAATPPTPPAKPAAPIFADKNLEAAVRAVLQHEKGELNDSNLINVYVLEAPGKSIANLTGLEKCKNLALLRLTNNQVVDLVPLKGLQNLQSLDLAGNKISDLTPLSDLTKLQYLELSKNQVTSVAPLGGLTHLSALYLSENKISNLDPLGNLSRLSSLSMAKNQVRELGPLAKINRLNTLDLNDNAISDLAPLTKQTELRLLLLERNKITDLAPLVNMSKADAEGDKRFAPFLRLYLAGNPLSETAKSQQLPALKGFGVRIEN